MPFEAQAIARGIAEHPNCIIKLGALQSVYDDAELFPRVSKVLEPFNVVLQGFIITGSSSIYMQ